MPDKTKIEQVAEICGWEFFPQGEFLSDRWEGPDGDVTAHAGECQQCWEETPAIQSTALKEKLEGE